MKMKIFVGVMLALLLFVAGGNAAYAAWANSSVTINSISWQGLAFGGGQAPTITWGANSFYGSGLVYAEASAWNDSNNNPDNSNTTGVPVSASVTGANGAASASFALPWAPFSSSASAPGSYVGEASASGTGYSYSPFTVNGSGFVQFTISYTMSGAGAANPSNGEFVYWDSYILATVDYTGSNQNGYDNKWNSISGGVYPEGPYGTSGTVTDTLTITRYFDNSEQGRLYLYGDVNADAKSAVPLPPALLLFGPGLFGLAAMRKRLTK